MSISPNILEAFRVILKDKRIEPRLKSYLITMPRFQVLFDLAHPVNPDFIFKASAYFVSAIVTHCYSELKSLYLKILKMDLDSNYDPGSASWRMLKNKCLFYLVQANQTETNLLCIKQLHTAENLTDRLGALTPLMTCYHSSRESTRKVELERFIEKWKQEPLVIEHLFDLYAKLDSEHLLEDIKTIIKGPLFQKNNPSHTSKLIGGLNNNPNFYDASGKGYQFIADWIIEIDPINPSTAAKLVPILSNWKLFEPVRQSKMIEQLYRLYEMTTLSRKVKELINKSIQDALEPKNTLEFKQLSFFSPLNTKEEKHIKAELTP